MATFKIKKSPAPKRGGRFRAQSQLIDTRYPQVWYDLEMLGEIQAYDTQTEASLSAEAFKRVTKKTRWRVVEIVEVIPE